MTDLDKLEALARLEEMAAWCERGDEGAEGSVLLSASVADEHAKDLRDLIASARRDAEEIERLKRRENELIATHAAAVTALSKRLAMWEPDAYGARSSSVSSALTARAAHTGEG